MTRTSIFRLAAVLLLLLTGAELFACEVLAPEQCESFGLPGENRQPQEVDDNCICCCSHILIVDLSPRPVELGLVGTLEAEAPRAVVQAPASIYHPPKA